VNFQDDLVALLTKWKISGNEIVLMRDFNEDVYTGILSAVRLSSEPLCLQELCRQTTGQPLPPTHNQGRIPIDAIFGTTGVEPTAATLLPFGAGVGGHQVFLIDLSSQSPIGDAFPRVLPAAAHLLNCDSNQIQSKYNWVLNQLANRHLLFHKLLRLGRDPNSLSKVQFLVRINKIDKELKEFMKASKRECHKYVEGRIEWCPETGAWMKRCWLLGRVQVFLNRWTRDPRNLFVDCLKHGLTDP
jgi:hypothetical protein